MWIFVIGFIWQQREPIGQRTAAGHCRSGVAGKCAAAPHIPPAAG